MLAVHVTDREGGTHTFQAKPLRSLMEVLRDNDVDVEAICGGCGACATCHVLVDTAWAGKLPARADDEQEIVQATASYDPDRSRLSCQITLSENLNGITVTMAPQE